MININGISVLPKKLKSYGSTIRELAHTTLAYKIRSSYKVKTTEKHWAIEKHINYKEDIS